MNDECIEYLIKKKRDTKEKLTRMAFIVLFALVIATVPFFRSISIAIAVIILFITIKFIFPATDLEYEYLYCDKTISIDKILGQQKRKHIGDFDLDKMEIVAPVNSYRLGEYKNRNVKTFEYCSNLESNQHKPYAIYYAGNIKIVLDLPDRFVKIMQNNAPRKVFMD